MVGGVLCVCVCVSVFVCACICVCVRFIFNELNPSESFCVLMCPILFLVMVGKWQNTGSYFCANVRQTSQYLGNYVFLSESQTKIMRGLNEQVDKFGIIFFFNSDVSE